MKNEKRRKLKRPPRCCSSSSLNFDGEQQFHENFQSCLKAFLFESDLEWLSHRKRFAQDVNGGKQQNWRVNATY
jgi:hypothetical protein